MHPDASFRFDDDAAMRAFAAERAFAHIFACADRPLVAHAPVELTAEGHLRFHLARRNPVTPLLHGLAAIASIAGPDAYVSPDWYETADQVPTWNYVAVEAHGTLRRLSDPDTVEQLDALSATHEARLAPKPVWTRHKMRPGAFEAMVGGITGFELVVAAWRGTAKLSQNKPARDRAGVIAAYDDLGRTDLTRLMRP